MTVEPAGTYPRTVDVDDCPVISAATASRRQEDDRDDRERDRPADPTAATRRRRLG